MVEINDVKINEKVFQYGFIKSELNYYAKIPSLPNIPDFTFFTEVLRNALSLNKLNYCMKVVYKFKN